MNQPETATSANARYQRSLLELAARVLAGMDTNQQAEAIAWHYVNHSRLAMHLLDSLEVRKQMDNPSPAVDWIIENLVKEIKTGHAKDFGIELEWPTKENP